MAPKRPKNLLLSAESLTQGEMYCQQHGTTLSRLVEDFLLALPGPYPDRAVGSPIVRRLRSGASYAHEPDLYRDFLARKRQEVDRGDE